MWGLLHQVLMELRLVVLLEGASEGEEDWSFQVVLSEDLQRVPSADRL
jgi:hypothetical protein